MSELLVFIGQKSFEEVKQSMEALKIKVKDTKKLYMLNFSNDSDFTDKKVRQASGIILEKNTNKLVHYSFEKCYDGLDNTTADPYLKELTDDEYSVELFFEGCVIKLFYYDETWNIATSKHIQASKNKWTSNKSFDILFKEAIQICYDTDYEHFLTTLDTNYSYTFLLQHPENTMIMNISKPIVFYINNVNLETLKEERPEKNNLTLEKTLNEVLQDKSQNYMIYKNNSTERIKILTNNFADMLKLRGQYPDIGLSFMLHLNDCQTKNKYLELFPKFTDKFFSIDELFNKTVKIIHTLYIKNYAEKNYIEIPDNLLRTIKQLHGQYKRTKQPIRYNDVYNKLISLDPKILAYVIGYKY